MYFFERLCIYKNDCIFFFRLKLEYYENKVAFLKLICDRMIFLKSQYYDLILKSTTLFVYALGWGGVVRFFLFSRNVFINVLNL